VGNKKKKDERQRATQISMNKRQKVALHGQRKNYLRTGVVPMAEKHRCRKERGKVCV
jgi:hypothetical protein